MFDSPEDETKKYFEATYYMKILDKLKIKNSNFKPNTQHDSQELLKTLKIDDFMEILHNHVIKLSHQFKEPHNFLYYNINYEEFKNIEIVLTITKTKYDSMQEIINEFFLGEENMTKRRMENALYTKVIDNDIYFVNKQSEYIIIQIKLFEFKNNIAEKKQFNIVNLSENICIKEIPETVLTNYKKITDKTNIRSMTNDINVKDCKNVNFELISIIYHGGTVSGGHYVNYSKQISKDNKKSVWVYYDDATVSNNIAVENFDKNDFKGKTPYLFLYKRIEDTP